MNLLLRFLIFCILLLFMGCGGASMLSMKPFDYPVTKKYNFSVLLKPAEIKSEQPEWLKDRIPTDFKSTTLRNISELTSNFFQDDRLNPRLILTPSVISYQRSGIAAWDDAFVGITITWTITNQNRDTIAQYFAMADTVSNLGTAFTIGDNTAERFSTVLNKVFKKSFEIFHSSYIFREFDICEPLYSMETAHQKSASMKILSTTKDENERENLGTMLMCYAARTSNKDLMEFLIQQGIAPNETEYFSGLRPINMAAIFGSTEIVRFLLDNGVDVNSESTESTTSLLYAGYGDHENTWKLLLDRNARIEEKNDSIFYQTAIIYQKFGDYLVEIDNSKKAAESYLIASYNFNIASSKFEKLADEISNDIWWSSFWGIMGNALSSYSAQLRANTMAKSMAALSPDGRGWGFATYSTYQNNTYDQKKTEEEFSRLAEECKENSIKCKELADSFK